MNKNFKKIIYKLCVLWKKIWGENLADFDTDCLSDDFYENIEKRREYKRKNQSVKAKRALICLVFVLIIYIFGSLCVMSFKDLTKTNRFFACLNKDICIYQGAKLKSGTFHPETTVLNNGNIYIFNNECHGSLLWYYEFYDNIFQISSENRIKSLIFRPITRPFGNIAEYLNNKYGNRESQIYDKKKNKFKKIKNFRLNKYFFPNDIPSSDLIVDLKNNVYHYSFERETDKYNYRENKFELSDIPVFDSKFYILTPYKNKYLVLSNNSDSLSLKKAGRLTAYEQLYLLDPNTFELEYFPNFIQQPKYFPFKKDIILLNNGKIIIPFRKIHTKNVLGDFLSSISYSEWDHIEIYDPEKNQFFVEYNCNALKENLFQIDLLDNDVLFINKNGSYIFKNSENKFEETEGSLKKEVENFVNIVNNTLQYNLGLSLEEKMTGKIKYIKLSSTKYLLTCGDEILTSNLEACKKSVYVNYNGIAAQSGPKFIFNHKYSSIEKIDDTHFMVIGGDGFSLNRTHIPNKYVQIIEIKER